MTTSFKATVIRMPGALDPAEWLPLERFDLMTQIRLRGTHLLTGRRLPWLRRAADPHVLSLSPPVNLEYDVFRDREEAPRRSETR